MKEILIEKLKRGNKFLYENKEYIVTLNSKGSKNVFIKEINSETETFLSKKTIVNRL